MAFVDTQPAPINHGDSAAQWARFRVRNQAKLMTALRNLCRNDTPLVVGAYNGPTLQVALWSVDDVKQRLHFTVESDTQALNNLSFEPELWAAAYMDDDKLQFPLKRLNFGIERGRQVLSADIPDHLYRLPRRQAMRVRRNDTNGPKARFVHPAAPGLEVSLKLLDVSSTGCAMLNPAGGPILTLGLVLQKVEIELNDDTILFSDLIVHHITQHNTPQHNTPPHNTPHHTHAGSLRVGCAWQGMPDIAQQRLREWIEGGRRRRDLMSLSFS